MTTEEINRNLEILRRERDRRSPTTKSAVKLFLFMIGGFIAALLGATFYQAWVKNPKWIIAALIFGFFNFLSAALYKAWKYHRKFSTENERSMELFKMLMEMKPQSLQGLSINLPEFGNKVEKEGKKAVDMSGDLDTGAEQQSKQDKANWKWNGPVTGEFFDDDGNLKITDPSELTEEQRKKFIILAMQTGNMNLANFLATPKDTIAPATSGIGYKSYSKTEIIKPVEYTEIGDARKTSNEAYQRSRKRKNQK